MRTRRIGTFLLAALCVLLGAGLTAQESLGAAGISARSVPFLTQERDPAWNGAFLERLSRLHGENGMIRLRTVEMVAGAFSRRDLPDDPGKAAELMFSAVREADRRQRSGESSLAVRMRVEQQVRMLRANENRRGEPNESAERLRGRPAELPTPPGRADDAIRSRDRDRERQPSVPPGLERRERLRKEERERDRETGPGSGGGKPDDTPSRS